jgi:hypothetical protein
MPPESEERTRPNRLQDRRDSFLSCIPRVLWSSTCIRCSGFMVREIYMDLLNSTSEVEFFALRCVQCGDVVDPVIMRHRETTKRPTSNRLAMFPESAMYWQK